MPGVYEGVQAHMGDGADVMGSNVPVHVGDNALGQVICLQLVFQSQFAQLGGTVPMAAHHTLAHALMAEAVAAGAVPVALTGREKQRQVPGVASLHKAVFQSLGQRFRTGAAHKSAERDRVAVLDHQGRFLSRDDTYFFHAASSSYGRNF